MISAFIAGLALVFQVLTVASASAVSFAECQAWLCLPGGFPPWECNAAHTAVLRRLAALRPALPAWSSCASTFGWDSASLGHQDRWYDECPHGGTPNAPGRAATTCRGQTEAGCSYSYSAQQKVTVQVAVDGSTSFSPNHTLTHTVRAAGSRVIDQSTCPADPDIPDGGDGVPPIVGPPASTGGFGSTGYN